MKILYITSATSMFGGGSKAFMNTLYGIMQYGIEPIVVFPDTGEMYQHLKQQNIPVYACFYREGVYPPFDKYWKNKILFIPRLVGRILANTIGTVQLYRICKKNKPDILHTNVSVTNIGYQVSRLLHLPHIWHIREYGALDFNFHYYYCRKQQLRKYKRKNSYSICITKDIQQYNQLAGRLQSHVVYDGVLPESSIYYQPNKQHYFLFAGRIEKAKGVIPLLEAYAQYAQQSNFPLPLHIAGKIKNDAYQQQCKHIITRYNIEDKVVFLGERDDILNLYREAQALIVPSLSEGFGFITAEAMFSGCLVVGHDVAGTKEQFGNGKQLTGEDIGLRYTTQEQLVQYLLYITDRVRNDTFTQTYEPMILRAQKVVKQLYTTEKNAEQVYQFYKNICSNDF